MHRHQKRTKAETRGGLVFVKNPLHILGGPEITDPAEKLGPRSSAALRRRAVPQPIAFAAQTQESSNVSERPRQASNKNGPVGKPTRPRIFVGREVLSTFHSYNCFLSRPNLRVEGKILHPGSYNKLFPASFQRQYESHGLSHWWRRLCRLRIYSRLRGGWTGLRGTHPGIHIPAISVRPATLVLL
jgi:hypothetical protein